LYARDALALPLILFAFGLDLGFSLGRRFYFD
jgi:hypothetical protein